MTYFNLATALIFISSLAPNAQSAESLSIDDQVRDEFTWVENEQDIEQIKELAKAGNPKIKSNSRQCSSTFSDQIGFAAKNALCLSWMKLPSQLMTDLVLNNNQRFANESDYDQRVTKFYAFRHDGSLNRDLSLEEIDRLFKAFNASVSFESKYANYHIETSSVGDSAYLASLSGLYVGTTFQDQTETFLYARDFFQGAAVKSISIPYEVGLYPGGGFTAKFELLISDRHLIFVKTEGWNS